MTRVLSNNAIRYVSFILIILAFSLTLSAQTGSVILEGTVWDPAGNLFPGAVLTAVQEESGREFEAVSDENGHYRFLALPPGQYSVTLKAKGFKNVMRRSIALRCPAPSSRSSRSRLPPSTRSFDIRNHQNT